MNHRHFEFHLVEEHCEEVTMAASRCEDYKLLVLLHLGRLEDLHEVCLFHFLRNQHEFLSQIVYCFLELVISLFGVTHFHYVEVRLGDELSEHELFWE